MDQKSQTHFNRRSLLKSSFAATFAMVVGGTLFAAVPAKMQFGYLSLPTGNRFGKAGSGAGYLPGG